MTTRTKRGFTLIEMMVSVTIFSIVMLIGVGALLSLIETNRRAQAISSVMNNLNAAVEGMSRTMRVGTTYYCSQSSTPPSQSVLATPTNCVSGQLVGFEASDGDPNDDGDQIVYRINGTQLERSLDSGSNWVVLTSPEVSIDDFNVLVTGAPSQGSGDNIQPRAIIHIRGSAQLPDGDVTRFVVQTTATQRLLDL